MEAAAPTRAASPRRRVLQGALAAMLGLALPRTGSADGPTLEGARLMADGDPVATLWLGHDIGHEAFTGNLASALWGHVPIGFLVRGTEAEQRVRALLVQRGLDPGRVEFLHDPSAPFFMRDPVVFGLDGDDAPYVVDFQWTHYGWRHWCRRLHANDLEQADACARTDDVQSGLLDRRIARALDMPVLRSPLAMEGGGVEANGQGLLIANAQLWRSRNPGLSAVALERELLRLPGIRKVIWLPRGLAQDPLHRATITGPYVGWGTGGHTDEFVRFAGARTVLLAWAGDADIRRHPVARLNQTRMQVNHDILARSTDPDGKPLRVIKVPLPRTIDRAVVLTEDADVRQSPQWSADQFPDREGRRAGDTVRQVATSSYLNHLVVNDLVLLPDYVPYGTPARRQEEVRQIYESVFPGKTIRFVDAMQANWVGGGIHCATLAEPGEPA